jgi:TolB-like protein/Tfp pilus assembly protein PilF
LADIFVSYSSEDRTKVQGLVEGLQNAGLTVWYDHDLAGGSVFSEEIEKELQAAKVVLAVWTQSSLKSRWVADEVEIGRDSGKLVPITLDGSIAPIGFRQYQAIDFSSWDGKAESDPFEKLIGSIARFVSPEVEVEGAVAHSPSEPERTANDAPSKLEGKKNLILGVGIAALTVIVLVFYFAVPVTKNTVSQTAQYNTAESLTLSEQAQESVPATIAVLAFVNMSSDPEQEYFSDGISEEILNLLARTQGLRVAARTSSFAFKNKSLDIRDVGKSLEVSAVLEGSVRQSGNRIRITAQLIEVSTGHNLWSETYDRQSDNVFQIQEDIAAAVVDALRITLLGEAPKIRKTDPKAYQLFLEGQYLKRQISPDSLNRAIRVFKQVVEIDPTYVPAWAELADTYLWGGGLDELSEEEVNSLADQAIEAAISTDPDYAFTYYVRGISWIFSKNDFKPAIKDFQYALTLDPDNAFFVAAIGKGAFVTGKFDLAITQYNTALAIEPIVPEFYRYLGMAYMSSGRLDEAEDTFRTLISLSPTSYGQSGLWRTLMLKGDLEAALAESDTSFTRAIIHHELGNVAVAEEALANLFENSDPYTLAMVYGYRGDVDKTFEWLNRHLEEGNYFPTFILGETAFHSVQSDPRWPTFLEKLGLLEFWLGMTPD